jgi:TatD DNase family protein
MRGKSCEPAYVLHTAKRIAELRGQSLEDIARITTKNAANRFGKRLARALAEPHT